MSGAAGRGQGDLPVHFFTIVLNGEPFIRYHLDVFLRLPFRWHWHIVEGVAALKHDTAWSVAGGGRIDASVHDRGLSRDGTSAYLDEIARAHPEKITLYRKPADVFWDGKREMVSAPLANLREECLLWQVDADELWTAEQIGAMRAAFIAEPERGAALFWCHYFVGPEALISTRYNYGQNPRQEWRRLWRWRPGDRWAAHEPPTLTRKIKGANVDIATIHPFTHDETEALGAVFQHFAYATPEQARFKESYYGYADAEARWRALQDAAGGGQSVKLRDYFAWVTDDTLVDGAGKLGVAPLARLGDGVWRFEAEAEAAAAPAPALSARPFPRIVVDAVFFQHNPRTGIARVWRALLRAWRDSGFDAHIVILDRAGTAPRLPGYRYRAMAAWNEALTGDDAFALQKICDEEGADLFISSYFTAPIDTPTVFVAHDFIPESLGVDDADQNWREKRYALEHASAIVCVSASTRDDLARFYPALTAGRAVSVIANAVEADFAPPSPARVAAFARKHDLTKPYVLMVGDRVGYKGYKDGAVLLKAWRRWSRGGAHTLVCVSRDPLEPELAGLAHGIDVRCLTLEDEELCAAYAGAVALVYPSRLEGFGLPPLEAMACGGMVIASTAPALREVCGEAALYFPPGDEFALAAALDRARDPAARREYVKRGAARAASFSWNASARAYETLLRDVAARVREGALAKPSPVWALMRGEQRRHQREIAALGAGAARRIGLRGPLARGRMRAAMFATRGWLLRHLPTATLPLARQTWRVLMGVRIERQRSSAG